MKKKLSLKTLVFTYIILIIVWSARIILLKPYIDTNLVYWSKEFVNALIKSIIWIGFAFYFIRKYNKQLVIKYNQMARKPVKLKILFIIMGAIVLYHIIGRLATYRSFEFCPSFHPSRLIGTVLLAGALEELLFRGWFYNGFLSICTGLKANLISSVFFVLIHYPSYIVGGDLIATIAFNSIGLFVASLLFGWAFEKSRSLWVPIILHMTWNIMYIIVGV